MNKQQAHEFAAYINADTTGQPFSHAEVRQNIYLGGAGYTVEAYTCVADASPVIFDSWEVCLRCMGEEPVSEQVAELRSRLNALDPTAKCIYFPANPPRSSYYAVLINALNVDVREPARELSGNPHVSEQAALSEAVAMLERQYQDKAPRHIEVKESHGGMIKISAVEPTAKGSQSESLRVTRVEAVRLLVQLERFLSRRGWGPVVTIYDDRKRMGKCERVRLDI